MKFYTSFLIAFALFASPLFALEQIENDSLSITAKEITIFPRHAFAVNIWTDQNSYHLGDTVRICFRTTQDAFVYIFDTEPNGKTHQIFPNFYDRDNFIRSTTTYAIPDSTYQLVVQGSAGWETLRIIAVRQHFHFLDQFKRGFNSRDPFPLRPHAPDSIIEKLHELQPYQLDKKLRPNRIAPYPPVHPPNFYAEDSTSFKVIDDYCHPIPPPIYRSKVRISSRPSRAKIYVDGFCSGKTPKTLSISPGYHDIRLQKSGYHDWLSRIYIQPYSDFDINALLQPMNRFNFLPHFR